jgi:hypothetical protein
LFGRNRSSESIHFESQEFGRKRKWTTIHKGPQPTRHMAAPPLARLASFWKCSRENLCQNHKGHCKKGTWFCCGCIVVSPSLFRCRPFSRRQRVLFDLLESIRVSGSRPTQFGLLLEEMDAPRRWQWTAAPRYQAEVFTDNNQPENAPIAFPPPWIHSLFILPFYNRQLMDTESRAMRPHPGAKLTDFTTQAYETFQRTGRQKISAN